MTYIVRALSIAWKQRAQYDSVFVHMNEEYPLLCGWLWRLMGKRVSMWRNHHSGTWRTRVAGWLCDRVLCTSRFSYTASFPNNRLMPVGVNLSRFSVDAAAARSPKKVLFLARLDRSKGVEVVIRAFADVTKNVPDATLEIVGSPTDPQSHYPTELAALVQELKLSEHVSFVGSIANAQTPQVYRSAAVFVNASSSGMYDKTIFEAMACGLPVVYSASGGVPELVGDTGYGVPVPEVWDEPQVPPVGELTAAMVSAAARVAELAPMARARAVANFDIGHWIDRHRAVFESLTR